MIEKYLAIKLCGYALQALGFVALMACVVVGHTMTGGNFIGMIFGLLLGLIPLALCFGAAEVLTLLTHLERDLRGLRDDIHERFPSREEHMERLRRHGGTS